LEAVGALVLADRIRPDAAGTLRCFAEQGVEVKVLSGDHPETVGAIADSVGLDAADPIDASELDDDPAALTRALRDHEVFGRVGPQRKRAMVHALQAAGHTVSRFRALNLFFGGCQAVERDPATGALDGGGDPRRGGAVVAA
jgi:cation-transporting ATPase E